MLKIRSGILIGFLAVLAFGSCAATENSSSTHPLAEGDRPKRTPHIEQAQQQDESWWERAADPVAIFTACLVIVGCAQLFLFYWQLRLIRESLADAKEAADGARDSAAAATKQARIAEDMLVKRERPYVFVFGPTAIRKRTDHLLGDDYFIEYTVANHGPMPAIIEGAWIGFELSDRAEPGRPLLVDDSHKLATNSIMPTGDRRRIRAFFPSNMIVDVAGEVITSGEGGESLGTIPQFDVPEGNDVFFKAIIKYHGPFSEGHETGAEWIYQGGTDQFVSRGGSGNYIS